MKLGLFNVNKISFNPEGGSSMPISKHHKKKVSNSEWRRKRNIRLFKAHKIALPPKVEVVDAEFKDLKKDKPAKEDKSLVDKLKFWGKK